MFKNIYLNSKHIFINYIFCSILYILLLNALNAAYAAQCLPGECNPNANPPEYVCNGGDMCCTGGGCPSYSCSSGGCDPELINGNWECCQSQTYLGDTPQQCAQREISGGWDQCTFIPDSPTRCLCYACGGSCGDPINPDPNDSCTYCTGGSGGEECTGTPDPATLVYPPNGATVGTMTINYDWNGIGDWGNNCTDRDYQVQVYSDAGLTTVVLDSLLLGDDPDTAWEGTATFVDGHQYWWRVKTANEENSAWSAPFSFFYNVTPSPTCTISGPSSITDGVQSTWQVTAQDAEGTVNRIDAYRRMFNPSGSGYSWGGWIAGQDWQLLGMQNPSCGGGSCTFNNINWTPTASDTGTHWLTANVWDSTQGDQCSGNPIFADLPPGSDVGGFKDCGATCRMQVSVTPHNPPVCDTIYGPTSANLTTPAYFNINAHDPDNDAIGYSWAWPASCTASLQTITQVQLRIRGTLYSGVGPVMQVYLGNENGTRNATPDCTYNVGTSWTTVTCNNVDKKASSIDVVFTNDQSGGGEDRNLFVDYIIVTLSDGTTRTIQSESNVSTGDKVIYDRGGLPNGPFDSFDDIAGTSTMSWSGSLRYPVPIKFTGGTGCGVIGTTHDAFDNPGGSCAPYPVPACGAPPAAATPPISPSDNATDVSINPSVSLSWTGISASSWGDSCLGLVRDYVVKATIKSGSSCPVPGDASYGTYCDAAGEDLGTTCNDGYFSFPNTNYCWYVETQNGQYTTRSATTAADVWEYTTENPILSQNWVTAYGAGAFASNVTMELPEYPTGVASGSFQYPYLAYRYTSGATIPSVPYFTSLFANITAVNYPSGSDQRSQPATPPGKGLYAEYAAFNSEHIWPDTYNGLAPSNAVDLDAMFGNGADCDDAFDSSGTNGIHTTADAVYTGSVECVNAAISGAPSGGYNVFNNGTAVVYVDNRNGSNSPLSFSNTFVPAQTNDRIVFVIGAGLQVNFGDSTELFSVDPPTLDSAVQVGASIVSSGNITFAGTDDPSITPDKTIIVEGPIMTQGNINFERNRGSGNAYPSEIVKYNYKYLYDLSIQERNSSEYNKSGLFRTDYVYIGSEDE